MSEATNDAEFDAVWNDSLLVLAIVYDPDDSAAAAAAESAAGQAQHREAVWIKDAALAEAKRTEHGVGPGGVTCFFSLDRKNAKTLDASEAGNAFLASRAFSAAEKTSG